MSPKRLVGSSIVALVAFSGCVEDGGSAPETSSAATAAIGSGSTSVLATLATAARMLFDSACDGSRASQAEDVDLRSATVTRSDAGVALAADYVGSAEQHDIVISFGFTGARTSVEAERSADGSGRARVLDLGGSDSTPLDPPQTIDDGAVRLLVPNAALPPEAGRGPVVVTMEVDGTLVETCA